jgi:F-type H+-transporting ATPase subunit delta
MAENNTSELPADVGSQRLARVYASALVEAADKQNVALQGLLDELDSLVDDVLRRDPQIALLLSGAAVGRHARRAAIEKAFQGRVSDILYRFLLVLNEHERLELLPSIRNALRQLDNERRHLVAVQVWTAVPMTDSEKDRVADSVRKRFQLEPVLSAHVDPDLLGGVKIRIGDQQIDDTVRTRLDNLRNQVIARSSYEIQSRRDRFRTQ